MATCHYSLLAVLLGQWTPEIDRHKTFILPVNLIFRIRNSG